MSYSNLNGIEQTTEKLSQRKDPKYTFFKIQLLKSFVKNNNFTNSAKLDYFFVYFYNSKLSSKQQSRVRLLRPPPHGTLHFSTPASSTSNGPHSPHAAGHGDGPLHSTTLDV